MRMPVRVLLFTNRSAALSGLVFSGPLEVAFRNDEESLVDAVMREFRNKSVDVHDHDILFFPDASPGYRMFEVGDVPRRVWPT